MCLHCDYCGSFPRMVLLTSKGLRQTGGFSQNGPTGLKGASANQVNPADPSWVSCFPVSSRFHAPKPCLSPQFAWGGFFHECVSAPHHELGHRQYDTRDAVIDATFNYADRSYKRFHMPRITCDQKPVNRRYGICL